MVQYPIAVAEFISLLGPLGLKGVIGTEIIPRQLMRIVKT
jgi:hypothetical protein